VTPDDIVLDNDLDNADDGEIYRAKEAPMHVVMVVLSEWKDRYLMAH